MGNCIVMEKQCDYGCGLCHSKLDNQYIFCPYCNCRFHNRCIKNLKLIYKGCPHCKNKYLRFIDKELHRNKI